MSKTIHLTQLLNAIDEFTIKYFKRPDKIEIRQDVIDSIKGDLESWYSFEKEEKERIKKYAEWMNCEVEEVPMKTHFNGIPLEILPISSAFHWKMFAKTQHGTLIEEFEIDKRVLFFDLSKEGSDYTSKITIPVKEDKSLDFENAKIKQTWEPEDLLKFESKLKYETHHYGTCYVIDDPENKIKTYMSIVLNGKRFYVNNVQCKVIATGIHDEKVINGYFM